MPDFEIEDSLNCMVAGVDEAGRGPWAGPVVAGAVIIRDRNLGDELLKGLDDSKKISAKKRELLYEKLREEEKNGRLFIGIGQASAEEIDRCNILQATFAAMKRAEETGAPAAAIELPDGTIVTGKTSSLLGASSAMLLNALKKLANLDHDVKLISPTIIEPIQHLKVSHLGNHNPRLHTDEILIALCICAATDEKAELAMQQLEKLKCCEVHSSVILSAVDENVFQKLGVNLTCEPIYQTKKLFHG